MILSTIHPKSYYRTELHRIHVEVAKLTGSLNALAFMLKLDGYQPAGVQILSDNLYALIDHNTHEVIP